MVVPPPSIYMAPRVAAGGRRDPRTHAGVHRAGADPPGEESGGGEEQEEKKKNKKIIWIEGIKAVVFKDLLHFVYTDELLPLDDLVCAIARTARDRGRAVPILTSPLGGLGLD